MYASLSICLLVIGAPTYFGLRWFLCIYMKDVQLRKRLTWIGTIVLTPLIYVGLVATFFIVLMYEPTREFDKQKWMSDAEKRYEMRDDLVNSSLLNNKHKSEVIELLGNSGADRDTASIWIYYLGVSTAGFGFQMNELWIYFENDRVIKVEKSAAKI